MGFFMAVKDVLRIKPNGLMVGGPPCGPWVWINAATHCRKKEPASAIFGDCDKEYVRSSNVFPGLSYFLHPILKGWLEAHRVIGFRRVVQAFNFLTILFLLSGFENHLYINHSLFCFSCCFWWLPSRRPKAGCPVGHATPSGWCSVRLHPDRTAGIFTDAPLRLHPVYPDRIQNRSGLRLVGCLFARPWANLRTLSNIHSFDSDYKRNHNDFDALRRKPNQT